MNIQLLAQNVRRLRNAKHFSQQNLAQASGLSLPAIKKLEGGNVEPRMNTLRLIAEALEVQLQELFYPVRELNTVRFRSKKRMRNRENMLANIGRWLDDFNFLEEILNDHPPFKLESLKNEISTDDIKNAARLSRKTLKLKGTEPIYDICGLMQSAGVKLAPVSISSEDFFGLSVGKEDGGPAIVVNTWNRIPVERRIFSTVHELGHLLLHSNAYDVSQTEENKNEEKEADLFSGHFLMPNKGFQKEWDSTYGMSLVDRVFKVKRIFRVSYKAVLHRLIELEFAGNEIWGKFNWAYQQRYKRKLNFKEEPKTGALSEPAQMLQFEFFEDRLSKLTRKAIEKDKISLSRGAEILGMSIMKMRELLVDWKAVS